MSSIHEKPVTLKRSVSIKALVTEKFKEYMAFEIQSSLRTSEERLKEIQVRLKTIEEQLRKNSQDRQGQLTYQQLESERFYLLNSIQELKQREQNVHHLKLGSYFIQGLIDGFVQVKVGDNLYEKLGGLEIVVEDGIIQEIGIVNTELKPSSLQSELTSKS